MNANLEMREKKVEATYEPPETTYGIRKRFRFCLEAIQNLVEQQQPLRIIELGCGTGEGLLIPLSRNLGREAKLLGIDTHAESINHAQKNVSELGLKNIEFKCVSINQSAAELASASYDLIIVSEVLEHIDDPGFLLQLSFKLLKPSGELFFTVPNGYGPFEWESFFWKLLRLDLAMAFLKKVIRPQQNSLGSIPAMTLNATSGHIGFYSWKNAKQMLKWAGFEIYKVKNTEWFCGPFTDKLYTLLKKLSAESYLVTFSQKAADYLPPQIVSDWMIRARKRTDLKDIPYPNMPSGLFERWWWSCKRKQNISL